MSFAISQKPLVFIALVKVCIAIYLCYPTATLQFGVSIFPTTIYYHLLHSSTRRFNCAAELKNTSEYRNDRNCVARLMLRLTNFHRTSQIIFPAFSLFSFRILASSSPLPLFFQFTGSCRLSPSQNCVTRMWQHALLYTYIYLYISLWKTCSCVTFDNRISYCSTYRKSA